MADTRNTRFAPCKETLIAGFTLVAIFLHVALRYGFHFPALTSNLPLLAALLLGGAPLAWELVQKLLKRQFGSDLLAGISILTAVALREYLVAAIVVLMGHHRRHLARRAIIIKNPAVLEQIEKCQTLIFDKSGTLTYGRPTLTAVICADGFDRPEVRQLAASLEQHSKHPLASAIVRQARQENIAFFSSTTLAGAPAKASEGGSTAVPCKSPTEKKSTR